MAATLQQAARLMGRKGGRVTASRLTTEQRIAYAKQASKVRWDRYYARHPKPRAAEAGQ